jgi:hypothetical protein
VTRVPSPKMIVLDGEILNFRWQCLEQFPEPPGSDGFHSCGGHSRRRPLADSLSASSKRKSSLPSKESASNWSSHRFCSRTRNHWTLRWYSSGDRPSIAASISSTRSILGVYHPDPVASIDAKRNLQRFLSRASAPGPTLASVIPQPDTDDISIKLSHRINSSTYSPKNHQPPSAPTTIKPEVRN